MRTKAEICKPRSIKPPGTGEEAWIDSASSRWGWGCHPAGIWILDFQPPETERQHTSVAWATTQFVAFFFFFFKSSPSKWIHPFICKYHENISAFWRDHLLFYFLSLCRSYFICGPELSYCMLCHFPISVSNNSIILSVTQAKNLVTLDVFSLFPKLSSKLSAQQLYPQNISRIWGT